MSQSLGNYIGVSDDAADMFGKTMSIPDGLMPEWFRLAANLDDEEVDRISADLASGSLHPNEAKRRLARGVVSLYWGEEAAVEAEAGFDQVFREGGVPDDIPVHRLPSEDPIQLPALIRDVFGMSGSEARRLIEQGAVRVDDRVIDTAEVPRGSLLGSVIKVGKRRFARLAD
jgi:tyrosyl-tRNA synthetase